MLAQPRSDLFQIDDPFDRRHRSVARDEKGARNLAFPLRIDLVTQASVQFVARRNAANGSKISEAKESRTGECFTKGERHDGHVRRTRQKQKHNDRRGSGGNRCDRHPLCSRSAARNLLRRRKGPPQLAASSSVFKNTTGALNPPHPPYATHPSAFSAPPGLCPHPPARKTHQRPPLSQHGAS